MKKIYFYTLLLISFLILYKYNSNFNKIFRVTEPFGNNLNILFTNKLAEFGFHQNALKRYSKIIENNKQNPYAYLNRGTTYKILGQYDLAIKDYNNAIKVDEDKSYFFLKRGVAKRLNNNFKESLVDFNKAIQLDQTRDYYFINRSISREKTGDFIGAILDLKKAHILK